MGRYRQIFYFALLDALAINLSIIIGLWLRFDWSIPAAYLNTYLRMLPYYTAVPLVLFFVFGLYHRVWRFASINEIYALIKAVALCGLLFFIPGFVFVFVTLPLSVIVSTMLVFLFFTGGIRFYERLTRKKPVPGNAGLEQKQAVLIIGAGGAGALVARTLMDNQTNLLPIGFADDNPDMLHKQIYGLPILGNREQIPQLVKKHKIKEIILAIPSIPKQEIRQFLSICNDTPAKLKILPSVFKVINGQLNLDQIRSIQLEDLLGREPVELDTAKIADYLAGQVVLVTGAGGSIGSELCREIAGFCPRRLILLGHGENSIYDIYQELSQKFSQLELAWEIADVRDRVRIEAVFEKYRPKVVFHAAAHKHVPLMETAPYEAFQNNVIGTVNVARAAGEIGAKDFILISTDKAVNPVSIMGATKRAAEMSILTISRYFPKTKFAAVRFGNVLGSRGSVLPLFKKQIANGGPVTVTHPDMTRYFMLISEAVKLVIQAGAIANGGEIFILDMGEPLKIVDLARDLIKLSGYVPGQEIDIVFTGIRPGEKIAEELLTLEEGTSATRHKRIFVAHVSDENPKLFDHIINESLPPRYTGDDQGVTTLLKELIANFQHG